MSDDHKLTFDGTDKTIPVSSVSMQSNGSLSSEDIESVKETMKDLHEAFKPYSASLSFSNPYNIDIGGHRLKQEEEGDGVSFECKDCNFHVAYRTKRVPDGKQQTLEAWTYGRALAMDCPPLYEQIESTQKQYEYNPATDAIEEQ